MTGEAFLFVVCVILIVAFCATFGRLLDVQEERRLLESIVADLDHQIFAQKMHPDIFRKLEIIKELKRENSQLRSKIRRLEESNSILRIINS